MMLNAHMDEGPEDFPEGGGCFNSESGCANLFFAENCMKLKEFGPGGFGLSPWHPP